MFKWFWTIFWLGAPEISQLIKQVVPKYTKKETKFGLEVLTGKALSFLLKCMTFIDKTCEKVFCLQMQIKRSFI